MQINISDPFTLTAVFEPSNMNSNDIVINEINYNSSEDFEVGDWIELTNISEFEANLSNWIFKDDNNDHIYQFPEGTTINPNNYLIIVRDLNTFSDFFPNLNNVIGPFDFGLGGGGDQVRIFDDQGFLIDSVQYDDSDPWPLEPDGLGPTLELINPLNDNSLAESWTNSIDNGSPGYQNTGFLDIIQISSIIPEKSLLYPAYPNPFNGKVTIPLYLSDRKESSLTIYNVLGQIIFSFSTEHLNPGEHSVAWNGFNDKGNLVSGGIYFAKLKTSKTKSVQKLLYLK